MYKQDATPAWKDSIKLVVLGFAMAHDDAQSDAGVPIRALWSVAKSLSIPDEDIMAALVDLRADRYISIDNEDLDAKDARYTVTPNAPHKVNELAQSQTMQFTTPALPFHRFVALAMRAQFVEVGVRMPGVQRIISVPFPGVPPQPLSGPGGQPMSRWGMTAGYGSHATYPQPPAGSKRETYAEEAAAGPSSVLVTRSTYIKGVEIDPDDARLLAFKLEAFLNAMHNAPLLNDQSFQIHITFKGIELNLDEALEVLTVLS